MTCVYVVVPLYETIYESTKMKAFATKAEAEEFVRWVVEVVGDKKDMLTVIEVECAPTVRL